MSSTSWTVGGDALTNFDPEQQHVYELAIERYAQIDPSHGFYIADAMPDKMGKPLPSLRALCRRQHGKDTSDFWRIFDACKKELGYQYPWQRRAAPSQPEGADSDALTIAYQSGYHDGKRSAGAAAPDEGQARLAPTPRGLARAANVESQCRSTAMSRLAEEVLVDGGSGTLRELLIDAADSIAYLAGGEPAPSAPKGEEPSHG